MGVRDRSVILLQRLYHYMRMQRLWSGEVTPEILACLNQHQPLFTIFGTGSFTPVSPEHQAFRTVSQLAYYIQQASKVIRIHHIQTFNAQRGDHPELPLDIEWDGLETYLDTLDIETCRWIKYGEDNEYYRLMIPDAYLLIWFPLMDITKMSEVPGSYPISTSGQLYLNTYAMELTLKETS